MRRLIVTGDADPANPAAVAALAPRWRDAWPAAVEAWSRFTRLRPPILCETAERAAEEGLTESFAMIRFVDQAVVVSLPGVIHAEVERFPVEILAHEIGHHILAPANLGDHARCLARMRRALPTVEATAPMVANLYTDLLINDRLQRAAGLRLADVWRQLLPEEPSRLWKLYLRIYELLWSLERGALGAPFHDDWLEGDAVLGMRVVRSYAGDWLGGAGRFAALLLPHLLDPSGTPLPETFARLADTRTAGAGGEVDGLAEVDPGEVEGAIHPADDPSLSGDVVTRNAEDERVLITPAETERHQPAGSQTRTPYVFGEILRAAGIALSSETIAARYYRERARPHLVPFPSQPGHEATEPLPEGLEPWDIGHPLDEADWLESILVSPHVVPGMTTVQRVWGTTEARDPARVPLDLDLYVDSSGSMPHPYSQVSFLTLAGTVMALSALRAGAKVQAVLWSDKNQVLMTDGFVRDEAAILSVLCGHLGGGTQFPIRILRDTHARRKPGDRPVHIMVISDDGVSTMFEKDEWGSNGWEISSAALARAGGGGSLVLNLPDDWERRSLESRSYASIRSAPDDGWAVHRVSTWDELLAFARAFSRRTYAAPESARKPSQTAGWRR